MITGQFHSFLTDLDVPLRTLTEPILLSPQNCWYVFNLKDFVSPAVHWSRRKSILQGPWTGALSSTDTSEHPQGSQHHAGYQCSYWCCRQQMISLRWESRPREGWSKCQNLEEQWQGKEGRHQPEQPGEPVGRGVCRGPKTNQSPSTLGAWRKARRLVILLEEYKQTSNCP